MTFPTVTNTSTGAKAVYRVVATEAGYAARENERLAALVERLRIDRDQLRDANAALQAALATAEALTIF